MNKRINNAPGKPSRNRGPTRRKLALSMHAILAERANLERYKADLAAQSARQKVKIEKRGWKDKTRAFFSRIFKQGRRGR